MPSAAVKAGGPPLLSSPGPVTSSLEQPGRTRRRNKPESGKSDNLGRRSNSMLTSIARVTRPSSGLTPSTERALFGSTKGAPASAAITKQTSGHEMLYLRVTRCCSTGYRIEHRIEGCCRRLKWDTEGHRWDILGHGWMRSPAAITAMRELTPSRLLTIESSSGTACGAWNPPPSAQQAAGGTERRKRGNFCSKNSESVAWK